MDLNVILLIIVPFCISFAATAAIHPSLVRFALEKNLVDNPNIRKLQMRPIPVLGGLGVFFGVMLAVVCSCFLTDCSPLFVLFGCMLLMMYVGAIDDMLDLSPLIRLIAQIAAVLILVYVDGLSIDNFHGALGVGSLPAWVSVPLTVFSVVGIINALNLIDGVDGLFGLFTISVCAIFAPMFLYGGDTPLFVLSVAIVGAMIPFLLHNAFGRTSKMFVGDSGTLLVGVALAAFVMKVICTPAYSDMLGAHNVGVIPLMLATLAVPVFDTVRVMIARIIRGGSPFVGDKTHLHHLFIWLGVSHLGTTLIVVALNLSVVAACLLAAGAGASVTMQLAVVVAAAMTVTCGIYYSVRLLARLMPERMERARIWKAEHRPSRRLFDFMRDFVDRF